MKKEFIPLSFGFTCISILINILFLSACSQAEKTSRISRQDSLAIYEAIALSENKQIGTTSASRPIEMSQNSNIKTSDLDVTDTVNHEVKIEDAKSMVAEYLTGPRYFVHRLNRGKPWRQDTKCIWFGKDLVNLLYNAVNSKDNLNVERNGIRIYFGVYDKYNLYKEQTLYKSVIITVTKPENIQIAGGKTVIANYDDLDLSQKLINDYWELLFNYQKNFLPPYNRGGLCPPPNDSCKIYGALLLPDGQ
jgi:hypothetical protein